MQPNSAPAFPIEASPSRYYAARGTDAVPLTVGDQHEKFLFYRGVARFPIPLLPRVAEGGAVQVENRGAEIPRMLLFENRQGRIGYRIAAGIGRTVSFAPPTLDGSVSQLRQELESSLVAQGLYRKEAEAMLDTWQDSWFEEGSRVIYILPQASVDAILPLHIDPVPARTVRVFVGRIELPSPASNHSTASRFHDAPGTQCL